MTAPRGPQWHLHESPFPPEPAEKPSTKPLMSLHTRDYTPAQRAALRQGRVISNGSERDVKAQGNILFIIYVGCGAVSLPVGW